MNFTVANENKKKYVLPSALILKNDAEDINDENVDIYEMIQSEEFSASQKNTVCCLGKIADGEFFYGDVAKFPHLLISGAAGMGKTTCIYSILTSLLLKATPNEVKFILVDPKGCELSTFRDIPHLLMPIITNPTQAIAALSFAVDEMERRFDKFEKTGARNIDQYNESLGDDENPMENIVIVIDELADLMVILPDNVENYIIRITQKARAAGIHLLVSSTRTSKDTFTDLIKMNIPSVISFRYPLRSESRRVLDVTGAETLERSGDMIYRPLGYRTTIKMRGAYVSKKQLSEIAQFWRTQGKAEFEKDLLDELNEKEKAIIKELESKSKNGKKRNESISIYDTEEFKNATETAFQYGSISCSLLQRKLKIGYVKAAKILDAMYLKGIIGDYEGQKPRKVLLTKEEYEKILKGEN